MNSLSKKFDLNYIQNVFQYSKLELNAGSQLFSEGEVNNYVFFVATGSIDIFKDKLSIYTISALEFVGITSCLNNKNVYTFSSVAREKSNVYRIKNNCFKDLLLADQSFGIQVIKVLCERIKLIDQKAKELEVDELD